MLKKAKEVDIFLSLIPFRATHMLEQTDSGPTANPWGTLIPPVNTQGVCVSVLVAFHRGWTGGTILLCPPHSPHPWGPRGSRQEYHLLPFKSEIHSVKVDCRYMTKITLCGVYVTDQR